MKYVRSCDKCQRTKTFPAKPFGTLQPNAIPSQPWEVVTTDMVVGLPSCQGYDSILVVCDRFTKKIHVMPTNIELSAEGAARLYRDNVWRHHGLQHATISDCGPQFASRFMKELNRLLGIKTSLSTAYHPQTDGQTERVNQEIEQFLRLFVNYHQNDWVEWLSIAEFSFNNKIHSATHYSPFYLDNG